MAIENTPEQIEVAFSKISDVLKEAILSVKNFEVLKRIRLEENLSEKQAVDIGGTTGLVLMGLMHPKDFVKNISAELGIEAPKANNIAQEINSAIFQPVKDDLRKLYGIGENAKQTTSVPRPPLAAELEENVGLRKQFEAVKAANELPSKRSLDADLSDQLRKPPVPPQPPVTPLSITPPTPPAPPMPPAEPLLGRSDFPRAPFAPSAPIFSRPPSPPRPAPRFVPPPPQEMTPLSTASGALAVEQPPQQVQNTWVKPPASHLPQRPQDREESLNREDLLREIENPTSVPPTPSHAEQVGQAQEPEPPEQYSADPYREPLE